jgi:hypothetical protein
MKDWKEYVALYPQENQWYMEFNYRENGDGELLRYPLSDTDFTLSVEEVGIKVNSMIMEFPVFKGNSTDALNTILANNVGLLRKNIKIVNDYCFVRGKSVTQGTIFVIQSKKQKNLYHVVKHSKFLQYGLRLVK